MKAFFLGMIGSLFALLLVAIVVPLYSDYEDRAYTENAITIIKPLKDEISNQILLNKKVKNESSHPSNSTKPGERLNVVIPALESIEKNFGKNRSRVVFWFDN